MAKRKGSAIGRGAIDWLKAQYESGVQYEGGAQIRDAIARAHTGKLARCTAAMATAWDRQARYELYEGNTFVTQPIAKTGWRRNPNAAVTERERTQESRLRELVTRHQHQSLIANAAAAQIDASRNEIRKATQIEIALRILAEAAADPVAVLG